MQNWALLNMTTKQSFISAEMFNATASMTIRNATKGEPYPCTWSLGRVFISLS